jgi:hypothetical protein
VYVIRVVWGPSASEGQFPGLVSRGSGLSGANVNLNTTPTVYTGMQEHP